MSQYDPQPPNSESPRTMRAMLDRLLSAILAGPTINCRPHNSRQRIDLTQLRTLEDLAPGAVIRHLLGDKRECFVQANVPMPRKLPRGRFGLLDDAQTLNQLSPEDRSAANAWLAQQRTLAKLRLIADGARLYEQDTGVAVMHVGYPLLSVPPGVGGRGTRRVLAPVAFIPIHLALRGGARPGVLITCRGEGADLIQPNHGLLAWLEQQAGVPLDVESLFSDEQGDDPWRELRELVQLVCDKQQLPPPPTFTTDTPPQLIDLLPAPRSEDDTSTACVLEAAVLGLYPMSNEGLIRDTRAMIDGDAVEGPVRAFLFARPTDSDTNSHTDTGWRAAAGSDLSGPATLPELARRDPTDERFIDQIDPYQARAVRLARRSTCLVVHGPPGTGKSQTITNIIGDHLARGQRVLFVCDKRTALDVVANRLSALGLADLCAVIHDPQHDRKTLYKSIREQIDALPEARTNPSADTELTRLDAELKRMIGELHTAYDALHAVDPDSGLSFHELVGRWLAIDEPRPLEPREIAAARLRAVNEHRDEIVGILRRGLDLFYCDNLWVKAAGVSLGAFLATPMPALRDALDVASEAARALDATLEQPCHPFLPAQPLESQARFRVELAERLERIERVDPHVRSAWAGLGPDEVRRFSQRIREHEASSALLDSPLDLELLATISARPVDVSRLARQAETLDHYISTTRSILAFIYFGPKRLAREVLTPLGLSLSPANATRAATFLRGVRARAMTAMLLDSLEGKPSNPAAAAARAVIDDTPLRRELAGHREMSELRGWLDAEPFAKPMLNPVETALRDPAQLPGLMAMLRNATRRAEALVGFESAIRNVEILDARWVEALFSRTRGGKEVAGVVQALRARVDTVESVLRLRHALAQLPPSLTHAVEALLARAAPDPTALEKSLLQAEITRRISTDASIQSVDASRVDQLFARIAAADKKKRELVRDQILFRWVGLAQGRLLAGTGSRLNSAGADLKRRFMLRGERAIRLRQAIALGAQVEGGDPLLDLRPVWMASPETVAQIFPRKALFDVVIFDEASQCRLEEALPVLTRGTRVVVAGDPKQLPPTRFFESAAIQNEVETVSNEQELFERQQSQSQDLLDASLGLDVQQSYLDVHYRSRDPALIGFSNQYFYGSRLQPVPAHPGRSSRQPAVKLYEVAGVYQKSLNPVEADKVVELVADLLDCDNPPSIGIACFNVDQRDLVTQRLDERAESDDTFARRLEAARNRTSKGAFEGLFVKNLENVQGDERDHIIISTTYGPDPQGKFRRNFGPLGQQGGGRRLNVLVTRAKHQVHLITSIPRSQWAALPPAPPDMTPGGPWLLYDYIKYAADLNQQLPDSSAHLPNDAPPGGRLIEGDGGVRSSFVSALASRLVSDRPVCVQTHWGGGRGFGIDLTIRPAAADVHRTLGVLCDFARFGGAGDPVEWDLYRNTIHTLQGWKLVRIHTPAFFRDPQAVVARIIDQLG